MSRLAWNTLKVGPALLGASLLVASSTLAAQTPATQKADTAIDKSSDAIAPTHQNTRSQQTLVPETASSLNSNITPSISVAQATPAVDSATPTSGEPGVLEQMQRYSNQSSDSSEDDPMGQVTNVSQFRDVQPSDWAYEALSQIVQKYGCLQGYPDGTYRGNRALSRYEFAAGLNACLRQIEALIGNRPESVSRADFERLQRLTEEFRTELATLGTRVDNLEGRTAFIEQRQFSTTTKLNGEVIAAFSDAFGDQKAGGGDLDVNTILSNRVRINFDTSFTGKDRLRTRLQARNTTPFSGNLTGTNMTRLGFDGNNNNNFEISRLEYRFPLTPKLVVDLQTVGQEYNDFVPNLNPYLDNAGSGSISRFGRFNPIYRVNEGGAALTANYDISKALTLSVGYSTPPNVSSNPTSGFGLFNGSYAALAQLTIKPSNFFNLGLTYVRAFNNTQSGVNVSASTGSAFANRPFGNVDTSSNQYSVEALLRLSPKIVISGWGGFTDASAEDGSDRNAEIWNYAAALSLPDFGKKGNLLAFIFGMPPKVTQNDISNREDPDTSYHIEGLYRYRLTDNIDITPGLLVILNPEHNDNNDTIYVGTLRTTFRF
jgi:BMFP domain-containing protein YqiC